jgi:uncharacterized protein involved in exopolysaccharide biosynthesis
MAHEIRAHSSAAETPATSDVRLVDILLTFRESSRTVLIVVAVVFAVMSIVVFMDKPVYRAYVTLAPAQPLVDPNRMSLTDDLLGLGLGDASQFDVIQARTSTNEAFALLTSREIGRRFIESENLMPVLFPDEWNLQAETWKEPDPDRRPSIDDALEFFERDIRFISKNSATGFMRINIEWSDPVLAASWANGLVELTDEAIRERDIKEAEDSVRYLRERAQSAPQESLRQLIYTLIESYAKTIMVARVKENYAFTIIDPAVAPREDQPINMPASFKLSLAMLFAVGWGLLYVVALNFKARSRRNIRDTAAMVKDRRDESDAS